MASICLVSPSQTVLPVTVPRESFPILLVHPHPKLTKHLSPGCGSEADTSIIRKNGPPLGKTNGGGPVDAAAAISKFMGGSGASTTGSTTTKGNKNANKKRGLLDGLLGGGDAAGGNAGGAGGAGGSSAADSTGQKTAKGTSETGVSKAAGQGASSGLPTPDENGVISMTFHQVNQDGAGPLTAAIDPTSGGTDASAFQPAQMVKDVPGAGFGGLSAATTTDFPIQVQMPAGMKCTGSAGGAQNVCVMKLQNQALAGPFGGSVAFTNAGEAGAGNATTAAAPAEGSTVAKRMVSAKFRA